MNASSKARYVGLAVAAFVAQVVALTTLEDSRAADIQNASADSMGNPSLPGSAQPNLASDARGRIYLSWLEPTDSGHALKVAMHDGARWSAARTVTARNDLIVNWADFPSVRVLDGGRLAMHWLQRDRRGSSSYGVRVAQSADDGVTWTTAVTPHRDTTRGEHGFVATWRETGKLGVVWLDGRKPNTSRQPGSSEMMLMSTTIMPNGTMGPEVMLDDRTCDCCQNAAAMTAKGPVIVYRDRSQEEIRDIYITRRTGGAWTPGVAISKDNWKIAACPVNGPAIDARENRVVVAWFTGANDSARVKIAFSDDAGVKFDAPVRVDGGVPAGRVDVALLADGAALVTWIERTAGDTAAVKARRVARDGKAGPPITIAASSAARASGFPRLALTSNHAVFAWTQPGRPSTIRMAKIPFAQLR